MTKRMMLQQVGIEDLQDIAALREAASKGLLWKMDAEAPCTADGAAERRPAAAREKKGRGRTTTSFVATRRTFAWGGEPSLRAKTVQTLQKGLLGLEMMAPGTTLDDLLALTSGRDSSVRVRWTGGPRCLAYLINSLVEAGLLVVPRGQYKWVVVRSHFADAAGGDFGKNLRWQKEPKGQRHALDLLVTLLASEGGKASKRPH